MVPEYQGYRGIGMYPRSCEFILGNKKSQDSNQASRDGGMPQPRFQWPEIAELKE